MCGQIAYDWKTIPIGRLCGPTKTPRPGSETTLPPISIAPPSARSSPAISRSVVVLPQPLGPSRVTSFALGDLQIDPVDRVGRHRRARVALGQSGQFDHDRPSFLDVCGSGVPIGARRPAMRRGSVTAPDADARDDQLGRPRQDAEERDDHDAERGDHRIAAVARTGRRPARRRPRCPRSRGRSRPRSPGTRRSWCRGTPRAATASAAARKSGGTTGTSVAPLAIAASSSSSLMAAMPGTR